MHRTTLRRELAPKARRGKEDGGLEWLHVVAIAAHRKENTRAVAATFAPWRLEKRCYCRPVTAVHEDEGMPLLHRLRRSPLLKLLTAIIAAAHHCWRRKGCRRRLRVAVDRGGEIERRRGTSSSHAAAQRREKNFSHVVIANTGELGFAKAAIVFCRASPGRQGKKIAITVRCMEDNAGDGGRGGVLPPPPAMSTAATLLAKKKDGSYACCCRWNGDVAQKRECRQRAPLLLSGRGTTATCPLPSTVGIGREAVALLDDLH
nr:hypothetical protein Iba_chr13cCG12970 [Ipomoea batatas]